MKSVAYFEDKEITYRIVGPGTATDIFGNDIDSVVTSPVQTEDVIGAFAKLQEALSRNPASGQRTFVGVAASDRSAKIDSGPTTTGS